MAPHETLTGIGRNHILEALPEPDRLALTPYLRRGKLDRGQELYAPGEPIRELYFPTSGLVSLIATLRSGRSVEVGAVAREGLTGLPFYPGARNPQYSVRGQIPGEGFFLEALGYLEMYARSPTFRTAIERYLHVLMTMLAQTAACNGAHDVVQRLAKWLLISCDASEGPDLGLTQEYLAIMIGVQRPTVTLAAGELQRAGLISYRRGKIRIHDRAAVAKRSCECYETVRAEMRALMRAESPADLSAAG